MIIKYRVWHCTAIAWFLPHFIVLHLVEFEYRTDFLITDVHLKCSILILLHSSFLEYNSIDWSRSEIINDTNHHYTDDNPYILITL